MMPLPEGRLPARDDPPDLNRPTPKTAHPRLLAIDDEPSVLSALDGVARRRGFDVITSSDSRAALTDIGMLKPDASIDSPASFRIWTR